MSAELATLAADPARVDEVQAEALPALIGETEALRARLWARLQAASSPAVAASPARPTDQPDRMLTAEEAAELLGVSKRWIYRKAEELPFTRRLSENTLRFSERGLNRWKERKR